MSKKLDEIREILTQDEGGISDEVSNALARAYKAGRDETADWLKKKAKIRIGTFGGRRAYHPEVDEESIEAAKTEPTLQP